MVFESFAFFVYQESIVLAKNCRGDVIYMLQNAVRNHSQALIHRRNINTLHWVQKAVEDMKNR